MKKLTAYQIWFIFSLIVLTLLGIYTLKLPFRGDERHIVETIKLFTDNLNFSTIKDYPEVTPPFFYLFYALWAKIFGASIESLRILTLIISFITWQLVFLLNKQFAKKDLHIFLLSLLIVANPYFLGTSVFVFTDMLTILLTLAAFIFFIKDRVYLFTIFIMLAILCRQYAVIFPLAVIIFYAISYLKHKPINIFYLIGSFLSFVPLLILFMIWKNISPASGNALWVIPNSSIYNLDYFNTYITFSVIYIFPIVILFFCKIRQDIKNFLFAIIFTFGLTFFPIKTSIATLAFTDYKTVGIVHEFLTKNLGDNSLVLKVIFWILLLIGCYINVEIVKRFVFAVKDKILEKEIILTILWFLFLLIMPFSYQVWEKYLTMILPFLVLNIYLFVYPSQKKLA